MTYILTLKENSFNNRFSTHRISLGMVYKSTFLLHLDRRWNYSIRYAGKQQKWRQIDNLVSGAPTSFPGSLRRVGENPRLRGRLALFSNLDQKATGSGNENAKENLCPCAETKPAPRRQPAGSIFVSVRPLKWDALQTFSFSVLDKLNSLHTPQNPRFSLHRKLWIKFDDCAIN